MTDCGFAKNLYIVAGIPGSGKSTLIKSLFPETRVVSSDAIRKKVFGGLLVAHEGDREAKNDRVFAEFHGDIRQTLQYGRSVVADATNLGATARARLRQIAAEENADVVLIVLTNIEQAVWRNEQRDEDAVVPRQVMADMIGKYWRMLKAIPDEEYANVIMIGGTR